MGLGTDIYIRPGGLILSLVPIYVMYNDVEFLLVLLCKFSHLRSMYLLCFMSKLDFHFIAYIFSIIARI